MDTDAELQRIERIAIGDVGGHIVLAWRCIKMRRGIAAVELPWIGRVTKIPSHPVEVLVLKQAKLRAIPKTMLFRNDGIACGVEEISREAREVEQEYWRNRTRYRCLK